MHPRAASRVLLIDVLSEAAMTGMKTIVDKLVGGTDLSAAAVLVAMDANSHFVPSYEQTELTHQLEDMGCVAYGYVTPVGHDVAKELRRRVIASWSLEL